KGNRWLGRFAHRLDLVLQGLSRRESLRDATGQLPAPRRHGRFTLQSLRPTRPPALRDWTTNRLGVSLPLRDAAFRYSLDEVVAPVGENPQGRDPPISHPAASRP